jgi:hypothetical protein
MTDTLAVDKLPVSFRLFQLALALNQADLQNGKMTLPGGGWADPFDAETDVDFGTVVNGSAYVSAQAPGGAYTFVDRGATILNSVTIRRLGIYSLVARTFTGKIVKRNSASNYDVVVGQSMVHPGTGWVDFDLTSAFTVPGSGTYHLAAYTTSGTISMTASITASVVAGDTVGNGQTITDTTSEVVPMRYSHSSPTLNQSYNATTDLYSSTMSTSLGSPIAQATGTNFGDMTLGSGLSAIFDGNTGTSGRAETTVGYAGKNYTSSPKRIYQAIVTSLTNGFDASGTSTTITLTLYGKNGSAPANGTDGTVLSTTTFTDTESLHSKTLVSSQPGTLWDYVWVRGTTGVWVVFSELVFYETSVTPNNMALVSTAQTASAQKEQALVVVQAKPNESITLATDLLVSLTRDTGLDYAPVTLTDLGITNPDGMKFYGGQVSLLGKPAGTTMRVKAQTANNKNIDISGWAVDLAA